MILQPLHGLADGDWHRGPPGKWTIAQIVEHLSIGVDLVATLFERRADASGMRRRSKPYQSVLRQLLLGVGRIPSGLKAPEVSRPSDHPDPELITAQFRMGVERLKGFDEAWPDERKGNVFVAHPLLGDLNLPEWVRFHYLHCRHHAGQIKRRRAGLSA